MKYIINERQSKLISESNSKKIKFFGKLVNDSLSELKMLCEDDNDLYGEVCGVTEIIDQISVIDYSVQKYENGKVYNIIKVDILYTYFRDYYDFEELLYSLEYLIGSKTGLLIVITLNVTKNTNVSQEW